MGDSLSLHVIAKPVGPACNLGCKYCFYLEKQKLYPDTRNWAMPPQVLESYIRQYIEAQPGPSVTFAWQGGEPTLLGIGFFQKVVELQKKHGQGRNIQNTFQTNGVLLNDNWAEFFVTNDFLVGVSIDGPRELHDQYRVEKGGQPTFDKVMNGIGVLKKHAVQFNLLTVVNRANSEHPTSVYRFLKEAGSGYIQFIPIVERTARTPTSGLALVQPSFQGEADLAPWSVEPTAFGRFLCTVFDQWVRQDVGRQFVQIFDIALEIWCGMQASLCVFGETCGRAVALEHTGDLYSCDHFVYPENKLGNIMDVPLQTMIGSEQQRAFGANKRDKLPHQCKVCDVRFACNGACPKHRFLSTPEGEPGLNYLCAGYKAFFHHIDPYMKFMAAELRARRAPANIMTYLAQQDMQAAGRSRPGRNDLCPCGSGRKYKRCCGVSE